MADEKDTPENDLDNAIPRLSIVELMVLTAAMAVTFSFQEYFASTTSIATSEVPWLNALQRVTFALTFGLPLAATWRFFVQKKMTGKFLLQPGHWVLFSFLFLILGFVISISIFQGSNVANSGSQNWYFLFFGVISLASGIVLIRGAMLFGWMWRTLCGLLAIKLLSNAAQMFFITFFFEFSMSGKNSMWVFQTFGWIDLVAICLVCVFFAIVVWSDLRSSNRRDFWHWMGIVLIFITDVVSPLIRQIQRIWL